MSRRTESADRSPFNRVYLFLGGLIAVAGVLLVVVVWLRQENDSLVRSASSIQLGATSAQVTSALGVPDTSYNAGTATGACYGRMSTLQFNIEFRTGRMTNRRPVFVTDFDDWPVHIRFDSTGVVDRIKYGDTIIEP